MLRGLHFQSYKGQDKLLECIQGLVWAVVVDVDKNSKTFGKWIEVDIHGGHAIYVPHRCAFGALTIEDSVVVCMCGEKYNPQYSSGIKWNDPYLNIKWPITNFEDLIISEKNQQLQSFIDYRDGEMMFV